MKEMYFVYNPRSGSALPLKELRAKCKAAQLTIKKYIPIDERTARVLARPIANGGIIVVLGGDGTINSLVNMVAGTQAIMAPLPGGTFNHFTKDAGIPQDLDAALERLAHAKVRRIDTVQVNDTYFVNNSLLGLYPHSLEVRGGLERSYGKRLSTMAGVMASLVRFHIYHIDLDGIKYRTPFVFVGNNNFGLERLGLPGRNRLDGGVICIYIARTHTRLGAMRLSAKLFAGSLAEDEEFESLKVKDNAIITTNRHHMRVSYDGELGKTSVPITYRLRPKSLRIL